MESRDLASNLEFWSGRVRNGGAGEDPRRRRASRGRTSFRPSWPRMRSGPRAPRGARPMAAAALVFALAAAWLVTAHRSHGSAAAGVSPPVAALPFAPPSSARTTTTTAPRTRDCHGLSPERRVVRCVVDGIDLDVTLYSSGTVAAAYRLAAGADVVARTGLPACARGVPDERAWSTATSPDAAVGRYRCRFERGRAAMWWTRGDRLAHAVAPGRDLAGLFSWWRAHPSE